MRILFWRKPKRQKHQTCCDCRFWTEDPGSDYGPCRRRAPARTYYVPDKNPLAPWAFWAVTHKHSWCGEFEKRK